jgi:hypothetical protein
MKVSRLPVARQLMALAIDRAWVSVARMMS